MRIQVAGLWTPGFTQTAQGPWIIETADDRVIRIARPTQTEPRVDVVLPWTAMPGLIDCHEHIGIDVGDEKAQAFEPLGRMLMRGVRNLRDMLAGGITTIRDCGERPDAEAIWIDALTEGLIDGPRTARCTCMPDMSVSCVRSGPCV